MTRQHFSKDALEAVRMDAYEGRTGELGGLVVAFESMPAQFPPDPAALFRGLPDDHCQCDHWGYLFSGSFRVTRTDGSDFVVEAGEAYHLAPGHLVQTITAVELIEFSPRDEHARTMAQVARNVEALQAAASA
jgi:hypothetical protein